jgi:hypothetical protein
VIIIAKMCLLVWLASSGISTESLRSEPRIAVNDLEAVVDLSGLWKCRLGDDPDWALVKTNDDSWISARLPRMVDQKENSIFGEQRIRWCRLQLYLPPTDQSKVLAIRLGPINGALEIYLNGKLIDQRGKIKPELVVGNRFANSLHILPTALLKAKDNNLLAFRFIRQQAQYPALTVPMELGPVEQLRVKKNRTNIFVLTLPGTIGLILVILGLAHLLSFFFGSRQKLYIYLALAELICGSILSQRLMVEIGLDFFAWRIVKWEALGIVISCVLGLFYIERVYKQLSFSWQPWAIGLAVIVSIVIMMLPMTSVDTISSTTGGFLFVALIWGFYLTVQALIEGQLRALSSIFLLVLVCVGFGFDIVNTQTDFSAWMLLPFTGGVFFIGLSMMTVVQDILSRKDAEKLAGRANQKLRDMSSIHRFGTGINSVLDLEGFLEEVIQEAAHQMAVRRCSLILVDDDQQLRIKASVGLPIELRSKTLPIGGSIAGWVYTHGKPMTAARLDKLEDTLPDQQRSRYVTNSFISWPLLREERIIGVLNVSDKNDSSEFLPEDEELVASLADRLAQVVDNALYYRQLKKENEQMKAQLTESN